MVISGVRESQCLRVVEEGRNDFLVLCELGRQTGLPGRTVAMHLAELVIQRHEKTEWLVSQLRSKLVLADIGFVLEQERTGTQPIGRLEQMGFSRPVFANDHVDPGRELQCQVGEDRKIFQFKKLDHVCNPFDLRISSGNALASQRNQCDNMSFVVHAFKFNVGLDLA